MGKPFMPNLQPLIAAGLFRDNDASKLKENSKKFLRLIDEQDFVNRFTWFNLPCDLTSQELERLLYYRGQLVFFFDNTLKKFFFMPYAGHEIDFYGRFKSVHPVPISSGTSDEIKKQADLLKSMNFEVVYGLSEEEVDIEEIKKKCVLLHDYTKQLSQTIIPRQEINDPILDAMSECIPLMRTSLLASSGVKAVRVADADQYDSVLTANKSLTRAAMTGDYLVPMVGNAEFQELTDHATTKAEEYMLALDSLDNFRLGGLGIDNGGVFQKKSHRLEAEQAVSAGPVGLVLQDGLSIRQNFCNVVNSLFGTSIWCEPSENVVNADLDGDGAMFDRNEDGANSGTSQEGESNDDSTI